MTPEITTRSFSSDQAVFDKVFFGNCYGLKGSREKNKIVVDIGAHAGYFTFTALTLGAKKVYSFEPYIDNFSVLLKNCYNANFQGAVTPYQLGVYTSPILGMFSSPKLVDGVYFDLAKIELIAKMEDEHYLCPCVPLSTILKEHCYNENVDILKLNIGYAEKEILYSCDSVLSTNVASICGEVSCNDTEFLEFKKEMGLRGFINCVSRPVDANGRIAYQMAKETLSNYFIE